MPTTTRGREREQPRLAAHVRLASKRSSLSLHIDPVPLGYGAGDQEFHELSYSNRRESSLTLALQMPRGQKLGKRHTLLLLLLLQRDQHAIIVISVACCAGGESTSEIIRNQRLREVSDSTRRVKCISRIHAHLSSARWFGQQKSPRHHKHDGQKSSKAGKGRELDGSGRGRRWPKRNEQLP